MKLQPASRRELKRISAGVLIGSAVMAGVFLALGKFSWKVITSAILGDAAAIGNFFYLCLSVQKAAAADEMRGRLIMRSSYSRRMLISLAVVIVGVLVKQAFVWPAVVIPLLLPRATILFLQLTGQYKKEG